MSRSEALSIEQEKIVSAMIIQRLNNCTPDLIDLMLSEIKYTEKIRSIFNGSSPLELRDRIIYLSHFIYDYVFNEILTYLQNKGIKSYYALHLVKDEYSRFSRDITSQILLRVHIKHRITYHVIPEHEIPLLQNKAELPVCY